MGNFGLHCVWSCTCLVEDMLNSLDDCDTLEKVINLTKVHEHNDVLMSTKVQEFRSRHAKYIYIIIVVVFYVIVMATNVILNQVEYQRTC